MSEGAAQLGLADVETGMSSILFASRRPSGSQWFSDSEGEEQLFLYPAVQVQQLRLVNTWVVAKINVKIN